MKMIDQVAVVQGVAERWKWQYCKDGAWGTTITGDTEEVYTRLKALPMTATAADVAAIIGNATWTLRCGECGDRPAVVQITANEDPVGLCAPCAYEIAAFVSAHQTAQGRDRG